MSVASKLRTNIAIKPRLSATLKNWLPILQSGAGEIEEVLSTFVEENPYVEIQSKRTQSLSKPKTATLKNSVSDKIESLSVNDEDLYEKLLDQITPSLFPTKTSQKIAHCVIENINEDGFLDSDIALLADEIEVSVEEFERVRKRFFMLEPCGVGAKDSKEAFYFQLQESDLDDAQYELGVQIIENLSNHSAYKKNPHYEKVMQTIKLFKNPPTGEFSAKIPEIIPDIFIFERLKEDSLTPTYELEVRINDAYYPNIIIEGLPKNPKNAPESKKDLQDSARLEAKLEAQKQAQDFTKAKIKEAKDLVDALDMRKATILKIALSLRENQYNFFMGGEITPMKLKDIAQDLGYAPSTISRAIANKYLECDRGIFPIKSFFTAAIDGDTSNASIKDFILGLVKNEDKKKPLSDLKILKSVEEKFSIKMVRRTITKYRQQLNIASSSERKKLYEMSM
ncbi:RNA polymerase factor sigma-54 [Helicobacter sp. MIT 00-7814]|uniref:RNA polymerase factor sigma-54 n=1 Tax=unclassified Helicobacter TaxID=2593540 RepID=UPI000E1EE9DE|nr:MULTISPECIES: RNA polymerase factor sigma-54 [unclassified Helicobacter]RDU57218.1 RNA polymerase factor sigma-54 [Helicobacter sp. MIT 00-7814]RDU57770.1 RNA polymerase factor sigma-54 [Helicobacter sp. MIT 99-10781]